MRCCFGPDAGDADPGPYDTGGKPIYFGGGKLAPDLTVPRLQRRWPGGAVADAAPPAAADRASTGAAQAGRADRFGLTPAERLRIWEQARLAAGNATDQITASALSDPASAADAAWAASDFLAAAGRVVEGRRGGPLSAAALAYDQAGRELFGRPPEPTAAGRGLRAAGRLLLAAHVAKPSETKQLLALLAQLAALADAVTRLRETQQRAAQAAAARQAAEQLRAVATRYQPPAAGRRPPARDADRRPRPDRATRLAQRRAARADDPARPASLKRKYSDDHVSHDAPEREPKPDGSHAEWAVMSNAGR